MINIDIYNYLNQEKKMLLFYIEKLKDSKAINIRDIIINQIIAMVYKVDKYLEDNDIHDVFNNSFFDLLYTIKDENNQIKLFLEKYEYIEKYKNYYNYVINNLRTNKINIEIKDYLLFLIENDLIKENDKQAVYSFIIGNPQMVSYEIFYKIFIKYCESISNTSVSINKYIPGTNKEIFIDEEQIKSYYYDGDNSVLFNLYKSISYLKDYEFLQTNFDNLDLLKDYLLSQYIPDYYEDNKEILSYEIKAAKYAKKKMENLGYKFDLKLPQTSTDERTYFGQTVSLNKAFNDFLTNNEQILEQYPILRLYYKVEGSIVIKRNI